MSRGLEVSVVDMTMKSWKVVRGLGGAKGVMWTCEAFRHPSGSTYV